MLRFLGMILILGLFLVTTMAQEEELTPYEIALQRIEEARVSGATSLFLWDLGLTELPPEIGSLQTLQGLELSLNQLQTLPPEIGQLSNLQILHLTNNHLTTLPPEIGNLSNLRALNLSHNQLSSLPPEIRMLESLCYLDLRDNNFQFLPTDLALTGTNCQASGDSRYLYLDDNPLISPPQEVIAQGTDAILEYLRNEAWWHLQRLIAGATGSIGIVAAIVLGLRWRSRRGYEKKKKG